MYFPFFKSIALLFQNTSDQIKIVTLNNIFQVWFKSRDGTDSKNLLYFVLQCQNLSLFLCIFIQIGEKELGPHNCNQFFTYLFAFIMIFIAEFHSSHSFILYKQNL